MKEKNGLQSWRIPLFAFSLVIIGLAGFGVYHSWSKGRLDESEIIDLSLVKPVEMSAHRTALQVEEQPYHYEFFALLDEPVPMRTLPEIDLPENPAIAAKAKRGAANMNKLTGKFAVQVSSYKNASEAQTLVRQLNVQGYHAVIVNEKANGQNWYRVRIDGGSKREQAESLQAQVQKKTGMKGLVVAL